MSAYIVSNETISAIAKGFEMYGCEYQSNDYVKQNIGFKNRNAIGQSLLNQNYKSVNYRYSENTKTPKFEYQDVEVNAGIILGCINCYIYQACETKYFFETELYNSLTRLKEAMLEHFISNAGYEVPWGID